MIDIQYRVGKSSYCSAVIVVVCGVFNGVLDKTCIVEVECGAVSEENRAAVVIC